jgi:hypothetical protein
MVESHTSMNQHGMKICHQLLVWHNKDLENTMVEFHISMSQHGMKICHQLLD